MPEKPVYPPGSSGSRSGDTLDTEAAAAPAGLFLAQWIAMPSKSATAWSRVTKEELVPSAYSGELRPNTVAMSPLVFSRSMAAMPIAPKSQPVRV